VSSAVASAGEVERRGYAVVCALASGGMGCVDLVIRRDGEFVRLFAQKRLRPHLREDEGVRRMFLEEGRIAGLVRHPNVVSVVDVGEDESGPYLVMELVEGVTLSDLIARLAAQGRCIPLPIALRIAAQIAEGLEAIHEARRPGGERLDVIHRDVSPQNVLVGFDGIARVTDFGIAKALGRATPTTTGILKGKLGYFAPERLRFEELDRRADLFSFGVVLFEMLAGRRLYDGTDDVEVPRRILHEPAPDIADERDDAEPELVELLFQLLAKDPALRPPDARTVAHKLEQLLASAVATWGPADTSGCLGRLFAEERTALQAKLAEISARSVAPPKSPAASDTVERRRRIRPLRDRIARPALLAAVLSFVGVLAAARGRRTEVMSHDVAPTPASPAALPAAGTPGRGTSRPPTAVTMPATAARRPPVTANATTRVGHRTLTGCDPPFTVDATGARHYKLRCLLDVRR
jgi:serine/threonine protein kinase